MATTPVPYTSYDQVPTHRKQWFFWLTWFLFAPVAIAILITGDVYYPKKGEVRAFGLANRIVAMLIALFWSIALISGIIEGVRGGAGSP